MIHEFEHKTRMEKALNSPNDIIFYNVPKLLEKEGVHAIST